MLDQPIQLATCTIRPLQSADSPSIASLANNPKIAVRMRNVFPSPYALSDAEEFIALANEPDERNAYRAIEVDGLAVGSIGLTAGKPGEVHQRTAEIGYWLGEPYWGRGIATDAVRGMVDELFQNTELLRLYATVYDGNLASGRVLEKAGFEKEGVLHAYIEKNGEILDAHLYARLSPALG